MSSNSAEIDRPVDVDGVGRRQYFKKFGAFTVSCGFSSWI